MRVSISHHISFYKYNRLLSLHLYSANTNHSVLSSILLSHTLCAFLSLFSVCFPRKSPLRWSSIFPRSWRRRCTEARVGPTTRGLHRSCRCSVRATSERQSSLSRRTASLFPATLTLPRSLTFFKVLWLLSIAIIPLWIVCRSD